MPIKYKLKKNDPVIVIAGKDKKTKSKIVSLDRDKGQVVVENVNVVKRHTKPNQTNPDGGIIEKTMPLSISKVMYYCESEKCKKGVRLGIKVLDTGKKVRFCKSCNEVIDKD